MSPRILVQNRQRGRRVDVAALKRFARSAVSQSAALKPRAGCGLGGFAAVDIVIVSDRRIAELHRRFMNISGPTDVITFLHGEIFVSADTAARQAKQFGTSTTSELKLYIIHGLLHLHGFDDARPAAARTMKNAQERILRQIG